MTIRGNWRRSPATPSDLQRTFDAGHGMASEPDRVGVELDRDPTVPPDTAALASHVCPRFQNAVPADKCSDAPVTAAAHRIFRDAIAWRKSRYSARALRRMPYSSKFPRRC